jgi:hypothetical protein
MPRNLGQGEVNEEMRTMQTGTTGDHGYRAYTAESFARWADIYDVFASFLRIEGVRRKTVDMGEVRPTDRVLDVCTGTGEFDASFISFGLHDMPFEVRRAVLREMARVIRKRIVITDYNPPQNHALHTLYIAIVSLYESKYFPEFARRDFQEFLARCGLEVVGEKTCVWRTCARMVDIAQPRNGFGAPSMKGPG